MSRGCASLRIAVVLGVTSAAFVLWWSVLTPLQRWYFLPYLNCSFQGNDAASWSEIRWLYKTAPRRQQELATDEDVNTSRQKRADKLPVQLSSAARKAGWTGLLRGDQEWIEIPRLYPVLRQEFYGDQSLYRILLTPLLWATAALLGMLAGENWFRNRWSQKRLFLRGDLWPSLFSGCADAMHRLQRISTRAIKPPFGVKTETAGPNFREIAAVKSPSESTQAGIPFFGAAQGKASEPAGWKAADRDRLM